MCFSSCWRIYLGKVCMPKSLVDFKPVWIAMWNTSGQAVERLGNEQSGEATSSAPTTKGCGVPSIIAPGQNERVLLWPMERTLPDDDQEMVPSTRAREGVRQGSGWKPFEGSSSVCSRNRWS